ncbi:MAG: hypothetical protein LAT84_10370 [Balneolia bacterium]|nr:hypothetical protein [Balneolia bacterium]
MKTFIFSLAVVSLLIAPSSTDAQSVSVQPILQQNPASFNSYPGPQDGENWNIRLDDDGSFVSASPALDFGYVLDYDFSPDFRHLAVLREDESRTERPFIIEIYNHDGELVALHTDIIDLEIGDPSLKLYLADNGNIIIRDNIVGFAMYDYSSLYIGRVSNASGSEEGETMSRLISSRDGSQMYVYNPRIIRGNGFSSRISRLNMTTSLDNVFVDQEREILNLTATNDGEFIFAVMSDQSGRKEVLKINSEGNVVANHRSEMSDPGFYVQPLEGTVTWFQDNQAQTYNIETGERIANAYFRQQNIVFAKYNPEDNVVITVTGSRSNRDGVIQANGIRVVDLNARELIHSDDLNHRFSFKPENEPRLHRTDRNRYQMLGVSNAVEIVINR